MNNVSNKLKLAFEALVKASIGMWFEENHSKLGEGVYQYLNPSMKLRVFTKGLIYEESGRKAIIKFTEIEEIEDRLSLAETVKISREKNYESNRTVKLVCNHEKYNLELPLKLCLVLEPLIFKIISN